MIKKLIIQIDLHLEEYLLSVLLVGLTIAMLIQVLFRYLFNAAFSWPEEFCRYCFIYFSFLTLGFCTKTGTMIRLDLIKKILNIKIWNILSLAIQIICLIFYIYFLIYSIELVTLVKGTSRTSPAMGIPFYLIYTSTIIGFSLAALRSIQVLTIKFLSQLSKKS